MIYLLIIIGIFFLLFLSFLCLEFKDSSIIFLSELIIIGLIVMFIATCVLIIDIQKPSQGTHYRTSKVTAVYEDSAAKNMYCINTQDGNLWKTGTPYKPGEILIFDTNNTEDVTDDKIIGIKEVK